MSSVRRYGSSGSAGHRWSHTGVIRGALSQTVRVIGVCRAQGSDKRVTEVHQSDDKGHQGLPGTRVRYRGYRGVISETIKVIRVCRVQGSNIGVIRGAISETIRVVRVCRAHGVRYRGCKRYHGTGYRGQQGTGGHI